MTQVLVKDIIAPVWQLCPSAPITMVVQAYIDAARKFCNQTRWLKATIAGATIVNTRSYSLGSDPYNEISGIQAIDITQSATDVHGLTERSSSQWDTTDANDVPIFYQYTPEGQFAVHPKPDAIYALSVGVILQPKRGSNSVDDSLIVSWDYALQQGALSYLLGMAGQPWMDKGEAQKQFVLFNASINSAAMSAAAGYNAGAEATNRVGPHSAAIRTKMLAI